MAWQGPDLPPLLLLPRLLPKPPSTASGSVGSEPEDWGSVGSGPEEPSPALALEVEAPGAWELAESPPRPMEGPWEPWDTKVGPAWGNPVAGRESELPRTPDSRPHQRWCYCLVENVNPL